MKDRRERGEREEREKDGEIRGVRENEQFERDEQE